MRSWKIPALASALGLAVAAVAVPAPTASAAAPTAGAAAPAVGTLPASAAAPTADELRRAGVLPERVSGTEGAFLPERPPVLVGAGGAAVGGWPEPDWQWVDDAPPAVDTGEKSILKTVAASMVLPGLGEQYVGYGNRAKIFYLIEGAIWSTFAFYRIQGDLRRDRYVEFANEQAAAPRDGDSDYYEHIGLWLSLAEWHDIVRRDARLRFPDDPTAQAAFFERNKRYDESEFWSWEDDTTRLRYRQLRSRSERSLRNSRLAAGAAIINRLASVIDALALARGHNRDLERERARLELRVRPRNTIDGLVVGPVLSARY